MAPKTDRYFIAIVPPPPVFGQALELKNYFQEKYQAKAALRSPPHVTLHMPFVWKSAKEDWLIDALMGAAGKLSPAKVSLKNFDCFAPRVIFINVVTTPELNQLQSEVKKFCRQELNLFNADYKDVPFHPHLTVAFRDLKKPMFKTAWEEFKTKEFSGAFVASTISLLKHDGKRWNVLRDFPLSSR